MSTKIFALGSNGSGQLGLGHQEDVSFPTKVLFEEDISSLEPCKIVAGGNHTLILFNDGSLYAVGDNSDGRCGLGSCHERVDTFRRVSINSGSDQITKFQDCSATWEASTLITEDGRVFCCGTGRKGELGQGKAAISSNIPQEIPDFPPQQTEVIDLAACVSHTVAVLSDGSVYGWGAGRKGQLGEPKGNVWTPRNIEPIPFKAARAVCGRDFTVIVGEQRGGSSLFLGSHKPFEISELPLTLPMWKDIGARWSGVHVLYEDGTLQSWGRDDHGQLATQDLPKLDRLAVGSEHVVARTSSGKVIAWGWGEHGNCGVFSSGTGETQDRWNVIHIDGDPQAVWAGCATSWIYVK